MNDWGYGAVKALNEEIISRLNNDLRTPQTSEETNNTTEDTENRGNLKFASNLLGYS